MSRILLTTWGSLGDLHPILAVGLGLRDRGHDIAIAAPESYRTKIESLGIEFHAIRPDLPQDPQTVRRAMDPRTGPKRVLEDLILGNVRDTYDDLAAAAKTADFLLAHEIVYAAPAVAEMLKLPWATCTLAPNAFFSAHDPIVTSTAPGLAKLHQLGPGVNRWAIEFIKLVTQSWGKPLYALRQDLGLPPTQNPIISHDKYSPHLVLALFSPLLGEPQPDWPPNVVTTGFTYYDGSRERQIAPELETFLGAGEPPLVFTLGSAAVNAAADFYAQSAQAAAQMNRRAVLLLGKNAPPDNLPPSILAWDYAPYSALFPRACAIVHQGGIGTTAQALRAGRPTLIAPYSLDQPDNAARAKKLGTSLTIAREQYSAARVVGALSIILEMPSYGAEAAKVGRQLRLEDGVCAACDALEKQLSEP